MSREGVFGYDDMFAFAAEYLRTCPRVGEYLRWRFPLVFIDEMQDTSPAKTRFLSELFGSDVVVQRFGDPNQAIYSEDTAQDDNAVEDSGFPAPGYLKASHSRRFCCSIASLAGSVVVEETDPVGSDRRRNDAPHTVFLFEEKTIANVLPAFRDLVRETFDEVKLSDPENRVVVVGAVEKRRREDSTTFPYSLCDYWDAYSPKGERPGASLNCLADFVLSGLAEMVSTGMPRALSDWVFDGLAEALRRNGTVRSLRGEKEVRPYTAVSLREWLRENRRKSYDKMCEALFLRCLQSGDTADVDVEKLHRWACALLHPIAGADLSGEARTFLRGNPTRRAPAEPRTQEPYNRLPLGIGNRSIEVGTINSEKGKEHLATLVVQSYWKAQDFPDAWAWLLKEPSKPALGMERAQRIRRLHVGMTRPRELLCLAMRKSDVPDANLLIARGWKIEFV